MFFLTLFSLMLVTDGYWWRWADGRLRPLRHARVWRGLLAGYVATLAACLLAFLLFPSFMRRAHGVLPLPLHAAVYLWHVIILPISCLLLIGGKASRSAVRAVQGERPILTPPAPAPAAAPSPAVSRRDFLGAAAVALPPLATGGLVVYSVSNLDHFRVNEQVLRIPNLPPDLDGLRIAHVSDMHVGKFTRDGLLPRVAAAANRRPDGQRPHLTLLTGDLIDLSISDLPAALDFVRRLDPLHGLAMCEGNHDLIDDPRRFYAGVRAGGVPLLIDEETTLELPGRPTPVQLLGLRWSRPAGVYRGGGESQIAPAMDRLLPQRRAGAFPILLAHHPHAFDPAAEAGIPLTLAGHTHGGQIRVFGLNPAVLMYRYVSGLYRQGDSFCFVSNGVGNWFPLRIGATAEVVHHTLRRA